jgi:hypothetical protein
MFRDEDDKITDWARFFLEPKNAKHRQYEALRAYFVERLPSAEAAARFGYRPGSFRVLCHQFRQNPHREFFVGPSRQGAQKPKKKSRVREKVIVLRKQNLSIYDISQSLEAQGKQLSPAAVSLILKEEGFARLPRRGDEERARHLNPERAGVADVRQLDLSPRRFRTQFGGLFLFVPWLARVPLGEMLTRSGFPGTEQIPAEQAVLSLLGLKLFGNARTAHVMSLVFDPGLALFAGLNVIPKRSFLSEYSCRIAPGAYPALMRSWFEAMGKLGQERGVSFDLDFHTIPFHGEDALVEKHYVSKRSRRQKGILAFVAHDASTRVFCYANAQVRKQDRADEILRFVRFWQERTGRKPEELIFDSQLTTYANLSQLNQWGIRFMTLRRRTEKILQEISSQPRSAWRRIELERVTRQYRTPRVLDQKMQLKGYEGDLRQLAIADLGHEAPTLLLTNHLRRSARRLVGRYARRMLIENSIADAIDFFHMDALSSAVAMKVSCDLQLTLMAGSLYRLLGTRIGNGYSHAKSRRLFRDFVQATAQVEITADEIRVRFGKRAHNPLLLAAGFADTGVVVPWLGGRKLLLSFG